MNKQILSAEILNAGLSFSMEFGENWLIPVHERLQKSYRDLDSSQLEFCDALCKKVNATANGFVAENIDNMNNEYKLVTFDKFQAFLSSKYEWISEGNAHRLYSQSRYYATK